MSAASPFLRLLPAYWLPHGQAVPAHIPFPAGAYSASPGPGGEPPGRLYGGGDVAEGDWRRTAAGWWFRLPVAEPEALLRPDFRAEEHIPLRLGQHVWQVRRLLGADGSSLVPRRLGLSPDLQPAIVDDPRFADLLTGLRAWRTAAATRLEAAQAALAAGGEQALAALLVEYAAQAAAVIATSYHLSLHEIAALGWWDDRAALDVLLAASGIGAAQAVQALSAAEVAP